MGDLEICVAHEQFHVSERFQPDGRMSYDFDWVNGPAEGAYGFTIGCSPLGARMTRDKLIESTRSFVESFYEPGGIRDEDFPEHPRARPHLSEN